MSAVGMSRSSDPQTSQDAAEAMDPTPMQREILRIMAGSSEVWTAWELADKMSRAHPRIQQSSVARRLTDLKARGWVAAIGVGTGPTGRSLTTYAITDAGRVASGERAA